MQGNKRTEKRNDSKVCSISAKCGGCQGQKQSYVKTLEAKQKNLNTLLKKYGKVEPIIGMENPYHYRNKVHGVVSRDRRGNVFTGVYKEGTHYVVPVDECLIEDKKADEIMQSICKLLKSFKIKVFDEDTGYGLVRHLLIRTGHNSGEIMVTIVTVSPVFPSKNNFVKALREIHPEITTVVLNHNDRRTSMVLGEKEQVLYGKGYIEDTLCEKVFRISSRSFYQVNSVQTEILYKTAIDWAGLTGKETVIDAYCGIGTIGLIASDKAKKVIAVESNKDAVKDAIVNKKLNNANNIEFYTQDASPFMTKLATQDVKVDVLFMDPPRSGSTEEFMDAVKVLKPAKVVYISCNPETLARDLEYLTKDGMYKVRRMQGVDLFPWTSHCEMICLLTAK
ncbi:MAG: 23S rRNA (uracil(1939)-C(5))-methyltransferase RlmD [Lachnospiraceae bacterium]|nr:23S rRNA (uracil(1939)-C(5))-methyltransferase RlmD [Lachnospiraceae bacterium]